MLRNVLNGAGTVRLASGAVVEGVRLETVVALANLLDAWSRVRGNKGGPGGDGVTLDAFAVDLDGRLRALRACVLDGTYRPRKVRRTAMPKPDGGKRRLAIPSVVDRVLQTAVMSAIGQDLDDRLSGGSWAYRVGRGVPDAVAQARQARAEGYAWVVDADIAHYFDRVPHNRLIDELTIWIDDVRIVGLIRPWLRSFSFWGRGIAQGSPISPLLSNLFLHPMDRLIEAEGLRLVRYADNFVVLCRTEDQARWAMGLVARHLRGRGLSLHARKTRIVPPDASFVFLGQSIERVGAGRAA